MVARQASARWFVKLEADSAEEVAVCLSRLQQAQAAGRGAVQTVTRSEDRVVCVQWQSSVTYNAARAWVKAAFGKGAADCATAFTLSLKRKLAEDAAPLAGAEKPLEVVVPLTLKLCGIARGEVPSTVYTLEAKLGEGTYGTVFASKSPDGTPVAVKRLKKAHLSDAMYELEVLRVCAPCPHIIDAIDVSGKTGELSLVFPRADCSLHDQIAANGPLEPGLARSFSLHIASGLRYMHGAGLIHNDVKPGNVLIKSGQALLADCGTAVAQRWQRQCDSEVTLPYRAPELLLGLEERTAKSDVWSAGLVLAEMGRGSRVFSEDSQVGMMFAILATCPFHESITQYPLWKRMPSKLKRKQLDLPNMEGGEEIVRALLQLDLTSRPSATEMEALLHAWRAPGCLVLRAGGPLKGARGPVAFLEGNVGLSMVQWITADEDWQRALQDASCALRAGSPSENTHLEFKSRGQPTKAETFYKVSASAPDTLNGKTLRSQFPRRLSAWALAFKKVNEEIFSRAHAVARRCLTSLEQKDLEHPNTQALLAASSTADYVLQFGSIQAMLPESRADALQIDGAAGAFHCALSIAGRRTLDVWEGKDTKAPCHASLTQRTGSIYIGQVANAWHQVRVENQRKEDLPVVDGLGPAVIAAQLRSSAFRHGRCALMAIGPKPTAAWSKLNEAWLRELFSEDTRWRLPSIEDCSRFLPQCGKEPADAD